MNVIAGNGFLLKALVPLATSSSPACIAMTEIEDGA